MYVDFYSRLAWLPQPPDDFSALCRGVLDAPGGAGRRLRTLASHALDQNQLERLARTLLSARSAGVDLRPLAPLRLGILSNSTVDFFVSALVATAARHGISLEVVCGNFDQPLQDALSPDSAVNRAEPDFVLIAIDYRGFPLTSSPGDAEAEQNSVQAAMEYLNSIRQALRRNGKATCILQTLAPPPETLFGSLDSVLPGSLSRIIRGINSGVANAVFGSGDIVFDVSHLASTVGLFQWHAPRDWNIGKFSFSDTFLPLYADHLCRILAASRGKSRRCLILDLDNTVWGGVIGDDGLENIQIAQGDATGEAFLSVQRLALDLRNRGVVLAVCSKNEDQIARLPFRKHPEMLLREEHIAVFQANWQDKATNIKAIAEELSLGLDAMVFLDDNPVERAYVRQVLPEVAVPELPDDPALYARTLCAAGYFEAVAFAKEDLARASFYQENARRIGLQQQAGDLESYLQSLNMEMTFQRFDPVGRARIAQLINKSNQFNLTTRRYSETDVAEMERDPACFTVQVRLVDRFGDNGMISVVICREERAGEWEIDTWLMSCRVLGRRVENMVLKHILEHAKERGIHRLRGVYLPTDRNALVAEHYPKLGFAEIAEESASEKKIYELEVRGVSVPEAPMKMRCLCCEAGRESRLQASAATATQPG
jgi:FkbH-like protein